MVRGPAVVAVLSAVALAGACTGEGSGGARDAGSPGSADRGVVVDEEYFPGVGTSSLDVRSYDVTASVTNDGVDQLSARADLRITALEDLERFELDLRGLTVDAVTVDGSAAGHSRRGAKLVVVPPEPIPGGRTVTTTVTYRGEPAGDRDAEDILEDGGGWLDLGPYSAVLAEPVGASTWLPSNDLPSDKATYSIRVTVPTPLEAVANGRLEGSTTDSAAGTTTYRWVADEPMAPYLMTLVVGDLDLVQHQLPDGTPVIDAWPPGTDPAVLAPLDELPTMMAFLTRRLGDYPFGTAGNVVVPGLPPTALETQTRPVLSVAALGGAEPDQLVVHELAHQWFGDLVTPATWADTWLNEGPAVYLQWSWAESAGGPTVQASARASWESADPSMDVPPADPGEDELFGRSVYERSAIFLVELEQLMGRDAFDELLRAWLGEHAGRTGTTEQFVALADRIHGRSVRALADPWLHGDELPDLSL